jgi:hypothetical protein
MQPDGGSQRIACLQCRANNFVGQPRCWQCQAPLPPPEALHHPSALNRTATSMPPGAIQASPSNPAFTPPPMARPSNPLSGLLLFIGIGALTFILVLMVALKTRPTAPVAAPQATLPPPDRVVSPLDPSAGTPGRSGPDPLTEQARHVIEREGAQLGMPPTAGPDGRIHVQSGGSVTQEEWKDATERLRNSPLLQHPPSAPTVGP